MCQLDRLQQMRSEINRIAQRHHADKVYVFGSCARKEETSDSDVDLLVEFDSDATLFDHVHIQDEIEKLLHSKVDVVSRNGLDPYIRKSVLQEAVLL